MGSKLSVRALIAVIVVLSLCFAFLHGVIANTQLETVGFAASNKNPNYIAKNIGYVLSLLGVLNVGIAFRNLRYSAILVGIIFMMLPIMLLLSF